MYNSSTASGWVDVPVDVSGIGYFNNLYVHVGFEIPVSQYFASDSTVEVWVHPPAACAETARRIHRFSPPAAVGHTTGGIPYPKPPYAVHGDVGMRGWIQTVPKSDLPVIDDRRLTTEPRYWTYQSIDDLSALDCVDSNGVWTIRIRKSGVYPTGINGPSWWADPWDHSFALLFTW